jgi:uncharacterized FlgJ-related protein
LRKGVFGLALAGFLLYSPANYYSSPVLKLPVIKKEEATTAYVPQKPATIDNLEAEIEALDIMCPEVVLAQVKLESGNLTSRVFKRSNNMFGMRLPNKRQTTAIGIYIPALDTVIMGTRTELRKYAQYSSYAAYATWQDAVKDYKLWQENVFRVNEKYMAFLQKYYAEDSLYVQRVQHLARKKQ